MNRNRFAARSFASLAAVLGGSLVVACSAAPGETTSTASSDLYVKCPYGQYRDCEADGPRGQVLCGACYADDGVYAITDLATTPSEATNPDGAWLDVSPDPTKYPYPPELWDAGCSKTAVYHLNNSDVNGGRIWYCAVGQSTAPSAIAPSPPPGFVQYIATGGHFPSPVLGSPKPGWYVIGEELWGACGQHCVINHGCSGACTPGP
jgi:hypothetical protein